MMVLIILKFISGGFRSGRCDSPSCWSQETVAARRRKTNDVAHQKDRPQHPCEGTRRPGQGPPRIPALHQWVSQPSVSVNTSTPGLIASNMYFRFNDNCGAK